MPIGGEGIRESSRAKLRGKRGGCFASEGEVVGGKVTFSNAFIKSRFVGEWLQPAGREQRRWAAGVSP